MSIWRLQSLNLVTIFVCSNIFVHPFLLWREKNRNRFDKQSQNGKLEHICITRMMLMLETHISKIFDQLRPLFDWNKSAALFQLAIKYAIFNNGSVALTYTSFGYKFYSFLSVVYLDGCTTRNSYHVNKYSYHTRRTNLYD